MDKAKKKSKDYRETEFKLVSYKRLLVYLNTYKNTAELIQDIQEKKIHGLGQGSIDKLKAVYQKCDQINKIYKKIYAKHKK